MNSINREQPEKNHENLRGATAIDKIREIVKKAENCFFCTSGTTHARPMNVRDIDPDGTLWFLSASDSFKNNELATDPSVRLFFQGSKHSDFLELDGRARVSTDRATIERLWEPVLQTWFTGGVDDPRITAISVTPEHGHYWDTKHGNLVAGIKMLLGAALRTTLDDSIEGELTI